MKVLLVWSGGVVPAYREFFSALGNRCELRVLSPLRWTHGSRSFDLNPETETGNFRLIPAHFFRLGASGYLIPAFLTLLIRFRPTRIYFMDEADRPATFFHLAAARILLPSARRVNYNLQNIQNPDYRDFFHALFLRLNRWLLDAAIAAGSEAEAVLRKNGLTKPMARIPLFASEREFRPVSGAQKSELRRRLGIPENRYVLMHAGSMVQAKGVDMLIRNTPRHSNLFLLLAGNGALETQARALPPSVGRFLGSLKLDALREAYQCSDAVILASRDTPSWKEQVGRSLLEGVLCGCLGLGSASGSIPDVLGTPETVFPQGDESALDSLLSRLPLPDSSRLLESQRQRIHSEYSAVAVANATADFLESL